MPQLVCQNIVKKLLKTAINYQNREGLIAYINAEDTPSWDPFLMTMPDLRQKYWQALGALQEELVPNHISVQDLYVSLWNMFKEVALNASHYHTRANLDERIAGFCQEVKKPLLTFNIIYEIKNCDVGKSRFNLGVVEVFKLTTKDLRSLGLKREASVMQDGIFKEWVGRSVAKLEVNVSDIDRAYETGVTEANSALNIIRLVAVRERLSPYDDEMFLWELGGSIIIPKVKPKKGTALMTSYYRGFRPLIVPMEKTILKGFEEHKTWQYLIDGKLPEDINTRVMKAMGWISNAVTSSKLDYKLVYLCTALEILLLPNHKSGTKGELIALRQMLVGRGTSYVPEAILSLYEKRSNIIHSGTLEITSSSDYWNLLICCFRVLGNIINMSTRHPDIPTLEDLIGVVETPEDLKDFIRHCDLGVYDGQGIKDIKRVATKRMTEIKNKA